MAVRAEYLDAAEAREELLCVAACDRCAANALVRDASDARRSRTRFQACGLVCSLGTRLRTNKWKPFMTRTRHLFMTMRPHQTLWLAVLAQHFAA
jgi:hypothetical protein